MDDRDIARRVAAKVVLADPDAREEILKTEIPFLRFAQVITLIPGEMALILDGILSRDKRHKLQVEGILRTFLQSMKG